MASLNRVQLIGNLGRNPEVRVYPDGGKVANVSLATTEKWTDRQSGEPREHVEWHKLVFNGRLAEIAEQYLRKGSQIYVEGSLRTREWQDEQSGQKRYSTEIRVDRLQMLGSRQDNPAPAQTAKPAQQQATPMQHDDFMNDDIPFVSSNMCFDTTTSKQRKMARYDY